MLIPLYIFVLFIISKSSLKGSKTMLYIIETFIYYLVLLCFIMVTQMFTTKVSKVGNSIGIIIPYNIVKYSGIKEGDTVKFYFKKTKEELK